MQIDFHTKSPRFLISRLTHIGDCVLTMPLASALKKRWPKSTITWAVQKPSNQLLALNSDIDEVFVVEKNWFTKPAAIKQLYRKFRNKAFDVSFDPQSLFKSAALARLAGAKHRLGFSGEYGREFSTWMNNRSIVPKCTHLVDRTLELLTPLGIKKPAPVFRMNCSKLSHVYVSTALAKSNVVGPYCVINPGASWPSKQWDNHRFAKVAVQLQRDFCIKPVITWSGEDELKMARQIAELSGHTAVIAPTTNLEQLAAICQKARFFLGCDTGPLHIASAMGTPCIALHGPTLPEKSGAYGTRHVSIQKRYQSGSARQRRRASNDAMMDIQVSDVIDACITIVAASRNRIA